MPNKDIRNNPAYQRILEMLPRLSPSDLRWLQVLLTSYLNAIS